MQDGIYDYANMMQCGNGQSHAWVVSINGHVDPGANIGRLMLQGYLGNYDLSPANAQANVANASFAPVRWCPAQGPPVAGVPFQSSYYMNPHWSYTTATGIPYTNIAGMSGTIPGPGAHVAWFRRIYDYPKTLAMLTETYFDSVHYGVPNSITHPGPGGTSNWNILLPDGHVATVNDKNVTTDFNVQSNSSTWIISGVNATNLNPFDDFLDILETEADGRNPIAAGKSSAMALPGYSAETAASPIYNRCYNYPSEVSKTGGHHISAILIGGIERWPADSPNAWHPLSFGSQAVGFCRRQVAV